MPAEHNYRSMDGVSLVSSSVNSQYAASKMSISPRSSGMSESSDDGDHWNNMHPILHDDQCDYTRSTNSLPSVTEADDENEDGVVKPARRVPPPLNINANGTSTVKQAHPHTVDDGNNGQMRALMSPGAVSHTIDSSLAVRVNRTMSESGGSPKKRVYRNFNMGIVQRWKQLATRARSLEDPWIKYRIDELPIEECIRYRYSSIRKQWTKDNVKLRIQTEPFARGAMRECYRVKKLSSFVNDENWEHAQNYVAKKYINETDRNTVFEDVKLQMDAKLWASEYNRHKPPKKIDIAQMCVLEFLNRPGQPLYHLEHYFEGEYIKYNSNSGFVCETARQTPHAFSHFTFERSGHQLIVVDVQGVGDLYTDPQIHTADGKGYGDGNLGTKGMALFFHSHGCNDICRNLGLTEFDLSVTERASLRDYIRSQRHNSHTVFRGSEEVCVSLPSLPEVNATESLRLRTLSNSNYDMDIGNQLVQASSKTYSLTPIHSLNELHGLAGGSHHENDGNEAADEGSDSDSIKDDTASPTRPMMISFAQPDVSSDSESESDSPTTVMSKSVKKVAMHLPNEEDSGLDVTSLGMDTPPPPVWRENSPPSVRRGSSPPPMRKTTGDLLRDMKDQVDGDGRVPSTHLKHLSELVDRVIESHLDLVTAKRFVRVTGKSWNESMVLALSESDSLHAELLNEVRERERLAREDMPDDQANAPGQVIELVQSPITTDPTDLTAPECDDHHDSAYLIGKSANRRSRRQRYDSMTLDPSESETNSERSMEFNGIGGLAGTRGVRRGSSTSGESAGGSSIRSGRYTSQETVVVAGGHEPDCCCFRCVDHSVGAAVPLHVDTLHHHPHTSAANATRHPPLHRSPMSPTACLPPDDDDHPPLRATESYPASEFDRTSTTSAEEQKFAQSATDHRKDNGNMPILHENQLAARARVRRTSGSRHSWDSLSSVPQTSINSSRMGLYDQKQQPPSPTARKTRQRHSSDCDDSASTCNGEDDEKDAYWADIRKKSRPACFMEVSPDDMDKLRELHEQRASESSAVHGRPSVLGQVHLDLARYHELERFVKEEGNEYDRSAAWFHLDLAAKCNIVEAVITMAQIHLGMQHELLKDFHIDDEGDEEEIAIGVDYMQTAAELGDRMAMLYIAEAYEQGGARLGVDREQSYSEAVKWYQRSLEALMITVGGQDEDSGCDASEYDSTTETHPKHIILAKVAELYRKGGCGLKKDASHAGDTYNEAAEAAMEGMQGKLANKYYILAEECYGEVEEEEEEHAEKKEDALVNEE